MSKTIGLTFPAVEPAESAGFDVEFDKMTIPELTAFAENNGIEIPKIARKKDEILEAILAEKTDGEQEV